MMGFSGGKTSPESGLEWVVAGIPFPAPLRPVYTIPAEREGGESEELFSCSKTPTSSEARIPARLKPPPAPKKRKATLKCNYSSRDFFNPPDLETVFIRHIERAKLN